MPKMWVTYFHQWAEQPLQQPMFPCAERLFLNIQPFVFIS